VDADLPTGARRWNLLSLDASINDGLGNAERAACVSRRASWLG
jgi:hypothetical protein